MSDSSPHSGQEGGMPPTGIVTFLFTDIEGSTRLLQQLGESYAEVLAQQRRLIRDAFKGRGGHEIDTAGDGLFVAFHRATQAVSAAIEAQRAITDHPWPENAPVRVRMGLHTGEATLTEEGYVGMDVHRSARICSAGHGGQILLSQTMRDLVENELPEGVSLLDLGEHRLKDLQHPEQVFQLLTPDLPADFPSLKSLDTLPNNLPRQLTSFIGREREIEEVKNLFSTTYLLTLTGSGGCGKTRLGLQVVSDILEEFPDGVWVVELAALSDPTLVPQEVASALGVREVPDSPLQDTLSNYLQSKGLLLMLDNCEHLIEACSTLSNTLLHSCPNLKILVASREALGIAGESTYRVPSLSLPDPKSLPPAENLTMFEAVRLFIDRAIAGVSTFRVTDDNAPDVAQICHRLDGIPLAIELAASRIKVLEVEEINDRLNDRFRLLTGGSRTSLPRQQTLRAAIDWSYNLLSESERVLLNRLSVFMGGWTLPAAEAICADEGMEEYEILDTLTQLVEKSLVVAEGASSGKEVGGKKRYSLLETVRQYGRDKLLESGEGEGLRGRHLDWFLELAEQAEPELLGPDQMEWTDRLEVEHDNLRAALEWALGSGGEPKEGDPKESGDPDRSGDSGKSLSDSRSPSAEMVGAQHTVRASTDSPLRLAGALSWFWGNRGYYNEGYHWLEVSLSRSSREPASERTKSARAKALQGAGWMLYGKSDYKRAVALYEESLALYRKLEDKGGIGSSLRGLGMISGWQGEYVRGSELLEDSLALFREVGDKQGIAFSLFLLSLPVSEQGDHERAMALCEESLALHRELGSKGGIMHSLVNLGHVLLRRGDLERAKELMEESLALGRELRNKRFMAYSSTHLGLVALGQDDHDRATQLFKESLVLYRELGIKHFIAQCLEGLAGVAVAQGVPERGARLLGAAEKLREVIGSPLPPSEQAEVDRYSAALREKLDEETFKARWAEGRAMPLEEAIEFALQTEAELQ